MEAQLFVFAAVAISEVFSACSPTGTKFENFQKTPKRSIRYQIGVVSKKCPGLDEFYYRWTVQEVPGYKTVRTSSGRVLTINGYSFPASKCYAVRYLVTVKVSHYPDMTYADEKGEIFHFEPDQMHIEILGGFEKCHPYGEDLVLDAKTLSLDPSYLPQENPFAGNLIIWDLPKNLENFYPPGNLMITVPANLLKDKISYKFKVTVMRTKIPQYKDVQTAIQKVDILSEEFPQLNILCLRNCIYPHHWEITVFVINCTKNCEGVHHKWELVPPVENENRIDFGDGFDKLIILNNAYGEGAEVKVNLRSGEAVYSLIFNYVKGLVQGNCNIHPNEGISAVTQFKINCSGFESPYGVTIYNVYQRAGPKFILINEESYFDESEVYLTAIEPFLIVVEVIDNAYLNKYVSFNVSVESFQPEENIEIKSAVKQLVLSADLTSITSYSLEGYNNEASQLIAALMETMYELRFDKGTTRDLHKHMAEAIFRIHPVKFSIAYQVLLLLGRMEYHRFEDDTMTAELMVKAMTHATFHVHQMFNHEHDKNIPQSLIENFVVECINLIANLLRRSKTAASVLSKRTPVNDYDSYDEYVSLKLQIRDDLRKILANSLITIQINCITVLYRAMPDEKSRFYDNGFIGIRSQRKSINILQTTMLKLGEGEVDTKVFLPVETMQELASQNFFVDFQTAIFWWNPFWWHINGRSLKTRVILFDVFFECKKLKSLENPFYIQFEVLSVPKVILNGTIKGKSVAGYRIELEGYKTLMVAFENVPQHYETYKVTWAECFCTDEDFNSQKALTIEKDYDYSEKILEIPNNEETKKTIFICLKRLRSTASYEMTLTTFACSYWDLQRQEWSGQGCKVIKAEFDSKKPLICECTHFSLFAGQIEIPRTILIRDADIDFTIDFVENYIMYILVSTIILLWLISLILAHLRDKSMKKKNVVHKLDDNVPGDPYAYLVVFFTGVYYDAPTTADVAFQLVGLEGKSRVHLIKCKGFKVLQRNTQDWFTLYCPFYLGEIKKIKIWHNSKGKSPHWYCERVIVQDLKTGTQYCFIVEKWFSLVWGEKKTFRTINLQQPSSDMQNVFFLTRLERDMRDKHIWLSIAVRDFQSNFNSKERVSAGFCFLFLALSGIVFFTNVPTGAPLDSIDEEKLFFLTTTHLIIFIKSWIAATALAMIIIFIFKNSRPL